MKSPTSSVGTIDDDGIIERLGQENERSRNTIRITGKKLTEYSTTTGLLLALRAARLRAQRSRRPDEPR
jgi:hypothetical protein